MSVYDNHEDVIATLETLFALPSTRRYVHDCETESCPNIACWLVVWMEGACEHMPTKVCALGKIVLDRLDGSWHSLYCSLCQCPIVPATVMPIPYKSVGT